MKQLKILVFGPSDSARSLRASLLAMNVNVKILKVDGSRYRGSGGDVILNWGSSSRRSIQNGIEILNDPVCVQRSSSKKTTFEVLQNAIPSNIPDWTTDKPVAEGWISQGRVVYCRTLTRSSQGHGIVVARTVEELVSAPLYTAKCPRNREIRVHVFNGQVIDFAQKKKMSEERLEADGITYNNDVRSHGNGWIFSREGITIPESAREVATKAVGALGLDFGAVDMCLNLGAPKVFEVNSAPGLEGTTLMSYRDAIYGILA